MANTDNWLLSERTPQEVAANFSLKFSGQKEISREEIDKWISGTANIQLPDSIADLERLRAAIISRVRRGGANRKIERDYGQPQFDLRYNRPFYLFLKFDHSVATGTEFERTKRFTNNRHKDASIRLSQALFEDEAYKYTAEAKCETMKIVADILNKGFSNITGMMEKMYRSCTDKVAKTEQHKDQELIG